MTDVSRTPTLPGSLASNPRLSQWLRILPEGRILLKTGKVEIGQGILTALKQIAADELDVAIERLEIMPATTEDSPKEGATSGSRSIQHSGVAIRHASACARAIHVSICAQRTGVSPERIEVVNGEFIGPDGSLGSYWAQSDDSILECDADPAVIPKSAEKLSIVGTASPRLDLPDKVFGKPRFIHDMRLEGMRFAAVIRPPSRGAKLLSIDDSDNASNLILNGDFVAVLCDSESEARATAARLATRIEWEERDTLAGSENVQDWVRGAAPEPIVQSSKTLDSKVARVLRREVFRPYIAHASMAPSCAIALYDGNILEVWTHSQGIYGLRRDLAMALGIDEENITVRHREGAGCYGHNAADDVAFDAAFIAVEAPGTPVRVMWSREDEMSWSPFSSAMLASIEAGLDEDGNIATWKHTLLTNSHSNRPGEGATPALLGASHLQNGAPLPPPVDAPPSAGGGSDRNATPLYVTGSLEVAVARIAETPLRVSALRSLGAMTNVFAIETMMDELAVAAGREPAQYRIDHLADQRAIAVLGAVNEMCGERIAVDGLGWGLGFARYKNSAGYCAVMAKVEVETDVLVRHLWIAADAGEIINPEGAAHQIEGGAVQACSFALKEEVRFDRRQVLTSNWDEYPILRFSEVPSVDVKLLVPPGAPPLGVGECSTGPTIAAIANAIHDAIGVRPSKMPFTASNLADEILSDQS
jgi:CO/xanthine dehydrogenase Mo-binding subunit